MVGWMDDVLSVDYCMTIDSNINKNTDVFWSLEIYNTIYTPPPVYSTIICAYVGSVQDTEDT